MATRFAVAGQVAGGGGGSSTSRVVKYVSRIERTRPRITAAPSNRMANLPGDRRGGLESGATGLHIGGRPCGAKSQPIGVFHGIQGTRWVTGGTSPAPASPHSPVEVAQAITASRVPGKTKQVFRVKEPIRPGQPPDTGAVPGHSGRSGGVGRRGRQDVAQATPSTFAEVARSVHVVFRVAQLPGASWRRARRVKLGDIGGQMHGDGLVLVSVGWSGGRRAGNHFFPASRVRGKYPAVENRVPPWRRNESRETGNQGERRKLDRGCIPRDSGLPAQPLPHAASPRPSPLDQGRLNSGRTSPPSRMLSRSLASGGRKM
jgi:hypothetical protein